MKTMRNTVAALAVAAIGLACAHQSRAEDQTLFIYSWADYIPPEVMADFTKETGIKVKVADYESVEIAETKLLTGSSGFDLVVTAVFTVPRLIKAGVLHELDHSKMPNIANLDADFIKLQLTKIDPQTRYAIPYDWGLTTIGYDADKVKKILGKDAPVDSLALLFDPAIAAKLQSCGIAMLDSAADAMSLALLYTGTTNLFHPTAEQLDRAAAALKAVRPYVRYFDNTRYTQDLGSGEICVAMAWNNNVIAAAQAAAEAGHPGNIKVSLPKEGGIVWSDQLVIPKDAPHPDAAQAFLDFLMRGSSAGAIVNTTLVAAANTKAAEFAKPELRNDPGIFPPHDWLRAQQPSDTFDQQLQRDMTRLFSEVKAGN